METALYLFESIPQIYDVAARRCELLDQLFSQCSPFSCLIFDSLASLVLKLSLLVDTLYTVLDVGLFVRK